VVKRLGFVLDRQKGSHAIYRREADRAHVVIAMHSRTSIAPKTLAAILDDLGISAEQLRDLL
jgi:predicted RNA binding protein YcfA (HicA-like mRNA interferase family)